MNKALKRATLRAVKGSGVLGLTRDSKWRTQRLVILCYHGISLEDEHLWRPILYVGQSVLQQRLEILKRGNYSVLSLPEAVELLYAKALPPRSVAITFDDGTYDFYAQAYPLLKSYGFPVTVYQSTYYTDYQRPVFNLACSYMLWKKRGAVIDCGQELGLRPPLDLRTEDSRQAIVRALALP